MNATIRLVPLAGLVLFAGAASAQPREFKPPVAQAAPVLDKVLMESFVTEPATIPPGATQVLLRVTVKNVTNTGGAAGFVLNGLKLKVFRTSPQPDVLELESLVNNLGPGTTQTFGAKVNIAAGVREYFARVDTEDTLHEPVIQRANNERRLKLTIPQVSAQQAAPAGSAPTLETQALDYQRAKNAGAQFSNGVDGSQGACIDVGQFNSVSWTNDHTQGVIFMADCSVMPNGVRATPEAFTGFRLKNGWKVKDYSIGANEHGGNSDWQWRQTPSKGTDDPYMRMHVWASALGKVKVQVKVTIEGPAGTNPYQ